MAERTRLLAMIRSEDGERVELSVETDPGDEADKSLVSSMREFAISRVDLVRKTVRLINEALVRLDDGEYGICLNCETPILAKRLAAVPWARYCVKCQELQEKGLLDEPEEEVNPESETG